MQTHLFHLAAKRRLLVKLGILSAALAMPLAATAAEITWQTASTIAAGSEVNTEGAQVYGRCFGIATGSTVNGVKFGYSEPWSVTYSEPGMTGTFNSGISGQTIGNPDAANYKAVLANTRYWGNSLAIGFGNLTIGQKYLFQVWVCDYRPYPNNRTQTVTGTGTNINPPTLKFLDSDLSNTPGASHGQYVIGTWIADATTMTFTFNANEGVNLDALQLRTVTSTVTATPVFSLVAGTYIGAQTVTLTSSPGATLYYTTDGSTPTNSSSSGISPVTVNVPAGTTMTIQAYGHFEGFTDSEVRSATYTTQAISSGVWTQANGGSWGEAGNWQGGVIPFAGTADFSTLDLTADANVTLDSDRTIGHLVFGDTDASHDWHLASGTGGALTLDTGSVTPTITVNNQTASISSVVAGTRGLSKAGAGTLALTGANTYTGATSVNVGTLRVTDLASHRSAVTIASAATFEANVAASVNTTQSFNITGSGTLKKTGAGYWLIGYTGRVGIAMGAGGLLDIQEGTVSVGSHQQSFTGNQGSLAIASGATLDISAENVWFDGLSGDGSIIMSYTGSGARTVTLGVANGGGTFGGVIGSGGYIWLTKTGSGTQVLTGSNTYTGTTTINGGTLRVNGSINSPVTLNGTLEGTGSVGGTVGGAGTIAPGSAGAGTLSTGAVTLAGTYACQLDGATSDKLAVTGALTLTNATLAISTLSAPTAASYVIATYTTGTAPAFTTVTGMPAGYVVDTGTAGQIKLVSNPMYATWGASKGLTAANGGMTQNPDGDGYNNLMEYGFATDPLVSASGPIAYANGVVSAHGQPTTSVTNTTNRVDFRAVFGRRKDYVAAGLTYTVQFSVDMAPGSWVDSSATPEVLASDAEIDAVSVPYPFFIPTARGVEKPTFFRVAVSSNP